MNGDSIKNLSARQRELLMLRLRRSAPVTPGSDAAASIPLADRLVALPLSWAQQRLWFLDQLDPAAGAAYAMPAGLRLTGKLDRAALQATLDRVVARHEALRTTFVLEEGQPVQRFAAPDTGFALIERDLTGSSGDALRDEIERLTVAAFTRPFDLAHGPLIRGELLRVSAEEHLLLISMHHIVSDGWSIGTLLREVSQLYAAFSQGLADPLPPLPLQYADHAVWERGWLQGPTLQSKVDYWKQHLSGAPALLDLPLDRPRPARQSYAGASVPFRFSPELSQAVAQLCKRHGVTLFMSLLAGWGLLMSRLSGQNDVVVGTPVANRPRPELEGLIGCFVNTLALRFDVSGTATVGELLAQVHQNTLAAYANQEVPFEQVVEAVKPARNTSHSLLFQTIVTMNAPEGEGELALPGLRLGSLERDRSTVQFDTSLYIGEVRGVLAGSIAYASDLFDRATIERLVERYEAVLCAMAADDQARVGQLDILLSGEREVLAAWSSGGTASYPQDELIHTLFEQQAAERPDVPAVEYAGESLSYGELNGRANQVAHRLLALGVRPGDRVALCVDRGLPMMVGLMGILKAGAGYVALDPAQPAARIAQLLDDCAPVVLLTEDAVQDELPAQGLRPVVVLDADAALLRQPQHDPRVSGVSSSNLAYVIYTSGSTGVPKGVMVEHRQALNLWQGLERLVFTPEAGVVPAVRVALNAAITFDASLQSILQLASGRCVVIVPREVRADGASFVQWLQDHEIDVFDCTPAQLELMCEAGLLDKPGCRAKTALIGGEAIGASRWRALQAAGLRAFNLYGPTECTVDATVADLRACGPLPTIGRPLQNVTVHLLDTQRQPVAAGVTGEIYIGGAGVARGYLNRPELTAERFIDDPFTPGGRLYKTGDLARWLPDSHIEYIGRNDFQVKLRGFRIELGEIEAALMRCEGVAEATVLAREDRPGDQRLVAYLRVEEGDVVEPATLRAQLVEALPDYMLPSAFVTLARWPLTPNGKLDRAALPAPDAAALASNAYEEPEGEVEQMVAALWQELLGAERVGRRDDFFELGGHSLLAVRLVSRLRQSMGVEVPLGELFSHPQLADFSARLSQADATRMQAITLADRSKPLPLSWVQQRLWFLDQLDAASSAAYHMPAGLTITGTLDRAALKTTLDHIVARHEVLRTTFVLEDGEPVQRIADTGVGFSLIEHDLSGLDEAAQQRELARLSAEVFHQPFDMARGPLIRGRLLALSATEHVLLINQHHIVTDGWSNVLLIKEVGALYAAFSQGRPDPLSPLALQYADYAAWQRAWLQGDVLKAQVDHWRTHLAGAPALLALRLDKPRPAVQTYAGDEVAFRLSPELSQGLKALGQRHGTTLFMTLLAGWGVLMARLGGQNDVVIGTPVANRQRREVEDLIGFFINTLAIRLSVADAPTVAALLARVKGDTLAAYAHQDLPFEQVVEAINPQRSLSHSPLFQTMLTVNNTPAAGELLLPGIQLRSFTSDRVVSHFDTSLTVMELDGVVSGSMVYATDLFERSTIEHLLARFEGVLAAMAADESASVMQLPLLLPGERERLAMWADGGAASYPRERLVHELIEQQAALQPDAQAVVHADKSLSYGDLNRRANQVAHRLLSLGVKPGDRVALCVDRGLPMMIGLLGILKAGAGYVPLDPTQPVGRLAQLLDDCAPVALLTEDAVQDDLPAQGLRPVVVLDDDPLLERQPQHDPCVAGLNSSHLAYVIYTSGSTGLPKGVMVEHRNVLNLWQALERTVFEQVDARSRFALNASFTFDASVKVIAQLMGGHCLVFVPTEVRADGAAFVDWLQTQEIDVFDCTPAQLEMMCEAGLLERPACRTKTVLIGGEAIGAARWRALQAAGFRAFNLYGPTECTVDATVADLRNTGPLPTIGRPLQNVTVHLLDAQRQPVAAGVTGEIYIGGAGVARGYLNRPELTAARFIDDSFTPGERLYKTGDLARWLPDGHIEYIGRNDFQVKLRGFRIELGEIEAALSRCEGVAEAAVLAREDRPGDQRLVAYLRVDEGDVVEPGALRAQLVQALPDYMVPSAFVTLASWPLTPNGKLDRAALPAPDAAALASSAYEEPVGDTEQMVASLWQELLGAERVGRRDDFFELGGHSLLAVRLVSRLRQSMGVEVPLGELFSHPQLADFSARLSNADATRMQAITLADRTKALPLSWAQQRLWFIDQFDQAAGAAYHMPVGMRMVGTLDRAALKATLDRIVARHEVLRTTFVLEDGEPVQRIADEGVGFSLIEHDLTGFSADAQQRQLERLSTEVFGQPFDMARGPLVRGRLLVLSPTEHVLLINLHHIVTDGWSNGVLVKEVGTLYTAFSQGRPDPLPRLVLQYADYAAWQRSWLQGGALQSQVDYWKGHLADAPELLALPTDRPRPAVQRYAGDSIAFRLSPELSQGLRALGQRHGTTLFMTLLAGWGVLMARLSGQHDVVIGTPVANRQRREVEDLIGFFINTLALRVQLHDEPSVAELLARTKANTLAAYAHQDIPFEQVVEAVQPPRSRSYHALFQTMLTVNNMAVGEAPAWPGLRLAALESTEVVSHFDTSLTVAEQGGVVSGSMVYAFDLFDRSTIEHLLARFEGVLAAMVADDGAAVMQLPLLLPGERERLAMWSEGGAASYPRERLVHELIEQQAALQPQALAVVHAGESLNYGDLNRRANQIAHRLLALGVKPGDRVALCVDRGLPMMIGLLGILKAGAGYVPLDPTQPVGRLAQLLDDCAPVALLTEDAVQDDLPAQGLRPVVVLDDDALLARQPQHDPQLSGVTSTHLAYVIYTSGSTGMPKGVMVEHRNVLNLWQALERTVFEQIDARSRFALNASFTFDASVKVIAQLMAGHCLVFVPTEVRADGTAFVDWLEQNEVDVFDCTPAQLEMMCDAGLLERPACSTKTVLIGGEAIGAARWRALQAAGFRAFNLYGPTECTVDATVADLRATGAVPTIGRPLQNVTVHLLDAQRQPVAAGVTGEIYIGGAGVARGYLNRPELTAERFIDDPFTPGERLYRTGDLARWLPDGHIEYVGRNDFQVKLRGFRIELGEIEAALARCEGVAEATVLAREDRPGDQRLVAYLRVEEGDVVEPTALRAQLAQALPDYMVPSAFVTLSSWPLTPNGKLDRTALPAPDAAALASSAYEAPEGETEAAVASLWQELLGAERVGRRDDFFELGGHSLLAVRLVSRLRQAMGVEVPLGELFSHPQLADFSARLSNADATRMQAMTLADRSKPLPLSWAQQRLWFIDQFDQAAGAAYHMPVGLRLSGTLDRAALKATLDRIVARHEVLRTTFVLEDGEPVQRIADEGVGFSLIEHDLTGFAADAQQRQLERMGAEVFGQPFDMARGPLLRGRLLMLAPTEHVLLINLHHIVTDGWSNGVLVKEVGTLYTAFSQGRPDPLPRLVLQYADYAAWQRGWLQGEALQAQVDHWKNHLAGAPELLALPTDRPRPAVQRYAGDSISFRLSSELSRGLKALGQRHGTTLFMTLLAGWGVLMARLSGQHDVVIGTPVANRQRREVEDLIGFFVNTLALRLNVADDPTVAALLARVKADTVAAYAHQDIPFEQVVEAIQPTRSLSHAPLFQVAMSVDNAPRGDAPALPGLAVSGLPTGRSTSQFDLSLTVVDSADGLAASLHFATELFDRSTVERWLAHWRTLLEAMVADEQCRVQQLPLLSATERSTLVTVADDGVTVSTSPGFIHQRFEDCVRYAPDRVALVCGDDELSYAQLNARANRLAHHLVALGVRPDDRVAVCVERGVGLVVSLLAVLKAGGAYVPLDPAYPTQHLAHMLSDSAPAALLLHANRQDTLASGTWRTVVLDDGGEASQAADANEADLDPASLGLTPQHLAYVIYTSGSTGLPKGVMIEHRSLAAHIEHAVTHYGVTERDRVLQYTSCSFDPSIEEAMCALTSQATLVMRGTQTWSGEDVADAIARHCLTIVNVVPVLLDGLVNRIEERPDAVTSLRLLIVGGEALSAQLAARVRGDFVLLNAYGPTETTITASAFAVLPGALASSYVPIGWPLPDTRFVVLDAYGDPVPIGVAGEIFIGGTRVARGYLGQPDLTAQSFVTDPWGQPGDRLYRTGDIGRRLVDGSFEYVGRNDHQVKVRGVRVELGEVEARLRRCDGVRDAIVVAREDAAGGCRLVAYVLADDAQTFDAVALRRQLAASSSDHMLPAAFVRLDAFPLAPSGKVDRRALPEAGTHTLVQQAYEAPAGEIEATIARLWQQMLGVDAPGRHDHFFELGGHSLLAVRLVSRMRRELSVDLPLQTIFAHPTLAALATAVAQLSLSSGPASSDANRLDTVMPAQPGHAALVPIRTGGTLPPLFLVHAGDGEVGYARELAKSLDAELPVYGVAASGFLAGEPVQRSVEAMAQAYVADIRRLQPEGPYRLAGWSLGGTIAYEMAQQLIGAGHKVGFVGLLDTVAAYRAAPAGEDTRRARTMLLVEIVPDAASAAVRGRLQALADAGELDAMVALCRTEGLLPADLALEDIERHLEVRHGLAVAVQQYVPATITVPVAYFTAQGEVRRDATRGWQDRLGSRLHLHPVAGTHHGMLEPAQAPSLARAIWSALVQGEEDALVCEEQLYSPRISIQSGRADVAPVFCVPGAGASVTAFTHLAQALGPNIPLHGLQPRGLCGTMMPYVDVPAAARAYAATIVNTAPSGPYHLVGHSYGGWVVTEVARQLTEQGRAPATVIVLDSNAPTDPQVPQRFYTRAEVLAKLASLFELHATQPLGLDVASFAPLDAEQQLRLLLSKLVEARLMPPRTNLQALRGVVQVFNRNINADYKPATPYAGRLHLAVAMEDSPDVEAAGQPDEAFAAWLEHAPQARLWHAPGNHLTMLAPPHVDALAAWIKPLLLGAEMPA